MVTSGFFSFAGRDPERLPEHSADVALERDCGTHKVVVLCAGDDNCAYGKAAAQLTAEALAGFLSFRFQRCMAEKQSVLRREMGNLITEVLTSAAEKEGADPSGFGCALMAAAMDHQGRWCLFHLGEGVSMGRVGPRQDWTVISYPQSIVKPGSTSLTMNCPMSKNLRFYRRNSQAGRGLLLLNSGALELFSTAPYLLEKPDPGHGLSDMEAAELPESGCSAA